jgi:hypothetical protein
MSVVNTNNPNVPLDPWHVMDYPPTDQPALLQFYLSLSHEQQTTSSDEKLIWQTDSAIIEQLISAWFEETARKECRERGRNVETDSIPWGGLCQHRLPDDMLDADNELNGTEERDMAIWKQTVDRYEAILFYQRVRARQGSAVTSNDGSMYKIVIWGIAERWFIMKAADSGSGECISSAIRQTTIASRPEHVNTSHRLIQYSQDRWLYPLVDVPPPLEEFDALEQIKQHYDQYQPVMDRFLDMVRALVKIEQAYRRSILQSSATMTSSSSSSDHRSTSLLLNGNSSREADVGESREKHVRQYLAHIDLSNPAIRAADWKMRHSLFCYTLSLPDAQQYSIMCDVGASIIQIMVELGWPEENHIYYLALRMKRNDHCIYVPRLRKRVEEAADASAVVAVTDAPQQLHLRLNATNGSNVSTLQSLVMVPGDTISDLESRFRRVIQRNQTKFMPIRFDTSSSKDIISPAIVVAQRFVARNAETSIIVTHAGFGGAWRLVDPSTSMPSDDQSLWDPFPTRCYFVLRSNETTDTDADRTKAARSMLLAVMNGTPWISVTGGGWGRRSAHEADLWKDSVVLCKLRTANCYLAVFPYIVFPSLWILRELVTKRMESSDCAAAYNDGVVFPDTGKTLSLSLQPPLSELCASLQSSRITDTSLAAAAAAPAPKQPNIGRIWETELPYNDAELYEGVTKTLARLESSVRRSPMFVWVRAESRFPSKEEADHRPLARVRTANRPEILARNSSHNCEGRIITYMDFGYWLGCEFRTACERGRSRLPKVGFSDDELARHLNWKLTEVERLREEFLPVTFGSTTTTTNPGRTRNKQQSLLHSSSSASIIRLDADESRDATATATCSPVTSMSRVAFAHTADEPSGKRADPLDTQRHRLAMQQIGLSAQQRLFRFPSKSDRDEHKKLADNNGEAFRDFLYERGRFAVSMDGDDPKRSLSITPKFAENTFMFYHHTAQFGGGGSYQLFIYWLFTTEMDNNNGSSSEALPSTFSAVQQLQEFKQEQQQRKLNSNATTTTTYSWTAPARDLLDKRFLDRYIALYSAATPETQKTLCLQTVWLIQCRKYEEFYRKIRLSPHCVVPVLDTAANKTARIAAASDVTPAVASTVANGQAALPAAVVSEKLQKTLDEKRKEISVLYHQTVPIEGTLAQEYLRRVRGLREISADILEHSPLVRFHPAHLYKIKTAPDVAARGSLTKLYPALLCFCQSSSSQDDDDSQRWIAKQTIYLNPDTCTKIAFEGGNKLNPAKKSEGCFRNEEDAYFPVQPGRLDLVPVVYLAEGPETAWSVASASRWISVYCSFGVSNYHRFRRFAQSGATLCLVLDRDPDNMDVKKTIERALTELKQHWSRVMAVQPSCVGECHCKDFNEVHQRHGLEAARDMLLLPREARVTDLPVEIRETPFEEWKRVRKTGH